jgi:hypothetical protein
MTADDTCTLLFGCLSKQEAIAAYSHKREQHALASVRRSPVFYWSKRRIIGYTQANGFTAIKINKSSLALAADNASMGLCGLRPFVLERKRRGCGCSLIGVAVRFD